MPLWLLTSSKVQQTRIDRVAQSAAQRQRATFNPDAVGMSLPAPDAPVGLDLEIPSRRSRRHIQPMAGAPVESGLGHNSVRSTPERSMRTRQSRRQSTINNTSQTVTREHENEKKVSHQFS